MSILRELFRSSMDEIWSQLSQEIGAEYRKDLFTVVLDEMCIAGSAYYGDPGIGIW